MLRAEVLDTLVADRLLEQQVKVLKLEVTKREIVTLVEDLQKRNGLTPEQFEQVLAGQGMTMAEYREGMRKQLLKMKIINLKVRSKVKVSEQDVKIASEAVERTRFWCRFIGCLCLRDY